MQNTQYRCLTLVAVLGVGYGVLVGLGKPGSTEARWPTEDAVYTVPGWTTRPADAENVWSVYTIVRPYSGSANTTAELVLRTSPDAKRIYRIGAELPFQGSGYTVQAAPRDLVPPAPGRDAFIVQRDGKQGLLLYAYGERRGLLGNGLPAWGLAGLDAALGYANDYYLMSIFLPIDQLESPVVQDAVALADLLFPRLAAWYAD
jgi:hypothetical protein